MKLYTSIHFDNNEVKNHFKACHFILLSECIICKETCWQCRLMNFFCFTVKHSGNLSMDDVIAIARQMRPRSMAKNLAGTCKEILGNSFFWKFQFQCCILGINTYLLKILLPANIKQCYFLEIKILLIL